LLLLWLWLRLDVHRLLHWLLHKVLLL